MDSFRACLYTRLSLSGSVSDDPLIVDCAAAWFLSPRDSPKVSGWLHCRADPRGPRMQQELMYVVYDPRIPAICSPIRSSSYYGAELGLVRTIELYWA